MNIPIGKAQKMLESILKTSGASEKDIQTMVYMLCEQNYYRNKFSGFSKSEIETVLKHLKQSIGKKSEIVVDRPSMKLIKGNGRSAWLIGMEMVDMVVDIAKKQGIGMVGLYETTYHNILETYTRIIAQHDLIGMVLANGGPAAVTPYGGKEPIFGTNPISYAFPANDLPVVFDGATSQFAYGTIRLAKERGEKLPDKTYLDSNGDFTVNPENAIALVPFGNGFKGYSINLMIEIMTGIMVRAKSGLKIQSELDLGSLFIAVDPSVFIPIDQFKKEVAELVHAIDKVRPLPGFEKVRVPGSRAGLAKQQMVKDGIIEIDDRDWQEFESIFKSLI